jgi:hypothetical protein
MPIHDCPHTFAELAATVLPGHMARLRTALATPWQMEAFARPGVGVKSLLKEFKRPQDYSGCYVLIENSQPIYVGISRSVIGRLKQHVCGKTHFDASLAFLIARKRHPDQAVANLPRAEAMDNPLFGTSFQEARTYLRSLQVATVRIENPLELYVFEPYSAIELNTHQWNSFETH